MADSAQMDYPGDVFTRDADEHGMRGADAHELLCDRWAAEHASG